MERVGADTKGAEMLDDFKNLRAKSKIDAPLVAALIQRIVALESALKDEHRGYILKMDSQADRIHSLEAENQRLKAPVTQEEIQRCLNGAWRGYPQMLQNLLDFRAKAQPEEPK